MKKKLITLALLATLILGACTSREADLGLSDNVSFFVEQTDAENVDPFHYRVIFRPESIIPDIDLQTSE